MTEYKAINFLAIMLSINVVLFLVQGALAGENPSAEYVELEGAPMSGLTDESGVNESFDGITGSAYEIDSRSDTGKPVWEILSGVFTQPNGFFKEAGVPEPVRLGFSILWYALFVVMLFSMFFALGGHGD